MEAPAPPAPRLASTILLARDGASGLEIFMVVRHHEIDFASGALVFPGGSAEKSDFVIAADSARCDPIAGVSNDAMAVRVAAIRETFEECGILLAREGAGGDLLGRARVADIAAKPAQDFAAMIASENLRLAPDLLNHYAHWVTPPMMPKRFDTHFFIARAPQDQLALHDGRENVDSIWINPAQALAAAREKRYTIIFPTRLNLGLLAECADVESALASTRARKIMTVMPEPAKSESGGRALRIPREAGYGGDVFEM